MTTVKVCCAAGTGGNVLTLSLLNGAGVKGACSVGSEGRILVVSSEGLVVSSGTWLGVECGSWCVPLDTFGLSTAGSENPLIRGIILGGMWLCL